MLGLPHVQIIKKNVKFCSLLLLVTGLIPNFSLLGENCNFARFQNVLDCNRSNFLIL